MEKRVNLVNKFERICRRQILNGAQQTISVFNMAESIEEKGEKNAGYQIFFSFSLTNDYIEPFMGTLIFK